ncbi:low temperature requirement A [Calothrix sp. NIES-3974]|nr:low temperature requirement A [Calothrix sp. NIES-3974]
MAVEKVLLSTQTQPLPDAIRWLLCGAAALCWFSMAIFHRLGLIRFCRLRAKYRLIAGIIAIAIAFLGHGLLPIVVIGSLMLVAGLQVVQDILTARPQTRLLEPQI